MAYLDYAGLQRFKNKIDESHKAYVDEHIKHILTPENYKEVMKEWFEANGCNAMSDVTELCERWYNISRTGWLGGTKFSKPSESTLSTGTKIGDNATLTCTPSTNTTAGKDDYAGIPLFVPLDCHANLDSDGKMHITAIDGICGEFNRYDTTKITAVIQMAPWVKYSEDAVSFTWEYTDQKNLPGFEPWCDSIELDGHIRNFVCHVKYALDDTYGSASGQKVRTWDVSHNSARTAIKSAKGNRYCAITSSDLAWIKMMMYIKYGSLTMDNIMAGCFSYYNHPNIAVAETDVERVIVPKSSVYVVGSTVCVGGDYSGTKSTMVSVVDRAVITSIETVTIDGAEYTALNLDNGGVKFSTTTDNFITTMPWRTGATDNVKGNDGSPISNSSVKEPYKLQGIELMMGCYEVMGDVILKHVTVDGVQYQKAFVVRDVTKNATSVTSDYIEPEYGFPVQDSSKWVFIGSNGRDGNLPELIFPDSVGGTSSTLTRDEYYIETTSDGALREALLFCRLDHSLAHGGVSTVVGNGSLGNTNWYIGSRVSLNGNRGEWAA